MKYFLLIILTCTLVGANAQIITTVVGNGNNGYNGDGGLAINAELSQPIGLSFDNSGNVIFCQHVLVRKVDKLTTIVTTIAGSDTALNQSGGGDGGQAIQAYVLEPYAACFDKVGNFYIADYNYNEVRKVTISTGVIDTFAGCRLGGNTGDGGPAKQAKFGGGVSCICIDTAHGFLYVSDEWNHRVRKVDLTTNIITAFAGTGTNGYSGDGSLAVNADFSRILGLAVDDSGNVFIGDWDNARIRKVDYSTGIVTTIAGNGTLGYSGDGALATNAKICKPTAICIDKCGNLYFTNEDSCVVRKIDRNTGVITTIAGNGVAGFAGDNGLAPNAELNHPTGLAIDDYGNLFISDFNNHRIRKVTFDTACGHTTEVANISTPTPRIYPNPAQNEITITASSITQIDIYNTLGVQVFKHTYSVTTRAHVSIATLPPGIYFVRVNDACTQKLVKQ